MPNKPPPELACSRRGFSSAAAGHKYRVCVSIDMSYFAYACKTEEKNDISRLISETA